jgi:hypothetical protein
MLQLVLVPTPVWWLECEILPIPAARTIRVPLIALGALVHDSSTSYFELVKELP